MSQAENCPYKSTCQMYGIFKIEGALNVWKINYCNSDFTRCSRYELTEAGGTPAVNLLPNGKVLGK